MALPVGGGAVAGRRVVKGPPRSGRLQWPALFAGTWRLTSWGWDAPACLRWIEGCVDLGVHGFDLADIYGDHAVEAVFGAALALSPAVRERLLLISKCGIRLVSSSRPLNRIKSYDTSSTHLVASVERSLRSLRTDRLDVLLLHRPDLLMDVDEVARTFERLQLDGKVLHFGVSNFTPSQFELLNGVVPLMTNQVEFHPLRSDPLVDGTFDQAQRWHRRPMVWSPLAGGRLLVPDDVRSRAVHAALQAVGERHGLPIDTVDYAWAMRHPSQPLVVVGSRRLASLQAAVRATRWTMDRETWYEILAAGRGHEVP